MKFGPRFKDISNQRFGRLTVISIAERFPAKSGTKISWLCHCDCGNTAIVYGGNIRNGHTTSCGCYKSDWTKEKNRKHDKSYTREYMAWQQAKRRCFNPKATHFHCYGGRGITMCEAWRTSFEAFYEDMGPCPDKWTLDRIDVNGNYEKSNCRWASRTVQVYNQRKTVRLTHEGLTLTLPEWAMHTNIPVKLLRSRYSQKLRPPDIFKPIRRMKKKTS